MACQKNAVSLLQEKCVKMGAIPLYTFDEVGNQVFKCKVSVGQFSAEATTVGKKVCKLKAAEALLNRLQVSCSNSSRESEPLKSSDETSFKITQSKNIIFQDQSSRNCESTEVSSSNSVIKSQKRGILDVYETFPLDDLTDSYDTADEELDQSSSVNFNPSTEDGVTTPIKKNSYQNPVSLLQEKMSKENPTYELINKVDNTYYYEVTAGSQSAIGSGTSVAEAKSNAAISLLQILGLNVDDSRMEVDSADRTSNLIGKLNEYCQSNHTKTLPSYETINETGKAHQKTFSVKCSLGRFSVVQSASTLKRARHLCAEEMLELLQKRHYSVLKEVCYTSTLHDKDINEKAWKRLEETGARNKIKLPSTLEKLPLRNYIYLFENNFFGCSDTLVALKFSQRSDIDNLKAVKHIFNTIMSELSLEYEVHKIPSKEGVVVLNIFIKSQPNWSFMAAASTHMEAETALYIKSLIFLHDM